MISVGCGRSWASRENEASGMSRLSLLKFRRIGAIATPHLEPETVREAVKNKGMFNLIHDKYIIKIDFVVRKDTPQPPSGILQEKEGDGR